MTNDSPNGPASHRVLPVVIDMCGRINDVFVRYVGPIAHEIADDIYEQWRQRGDTGPSGVTDYIRLLEQMKASVRREEAGAAMRQALQRRP